MNPSKTEFLQLGSKMNTAKCSIDQINVNGENVRKSNEIKYLGTWVDGQLSFKKHITQKCKSAMWGIFKIKRIRQYLTHDACATLMTGMVLSHLDYANAIFIGLPDCELKKLQRVQNIAAKTVLYKQKQDSSTECLKQLHWLPVKLRIQHKILTLVYKCINNLAPKYLKDLLMYIPHRRTTRSSTSLGMLYVPFTRRNTFAARSFSVMGPTWWNALPSEIKLAKSVDAFKRQLKTHLFNQF